jgi:hypothetical protein
LGLKGIHKIIFGQPRRAFIILGKEGQHNTKRKEAPRIPRTSSFIAPRVPSANSYYGYIFIQDRGQHNNNLDVD